jgi:hypothetical protein
MMLLTTILLGGLTVVLNPQATVRGTELTVGEIAEVRGEDTELVERIKSLELGWAPAPGYTRTLQRWQIEQKLQSGFPGTTLLVEGARVVRVTPLTQKITGTELRARAEAELRALFGSREAILTRENALRSCAASSTSANNARAFGRSPCRSGWMEHPSARSGSPIRSNGTHWCRSCCAM